MSAENPIIKLFDSLSFYVKKAGRYFFRPSVVKD